ncbi:class I adenylate-forming enzyme family protein [Mycobacterium sp. CVI_P3]|uniref:Class I adenylate-forming enzyme family protein n=1 Tax=Mycobacterium pinniadriaticum TaxID=2994102 RepID=A0ABT3SAD0_9MYCO|nr:class I adenylate-forming enzyme family protein [Mycobacterium pinniadriaticum]MCX2929880.1 class I adenylate-forming enzyme family protein [Mycobacterium pinniadriaticum]MCX2936471.1 class I adenylate-forming enzyme family protein [Mycobacterium pinniadriaticum]
MTAPCHVAPRWGSDVTVTGTGRHYTHRPACVGDLLTDVARWGQRPVLIAGQRRITFAEHLADVNEVIADLRRRGVQPGSRVVLLGVNSPEWVTAFWAIARIGGVVVFANAWWNDEEVREVLGRVGPDLVVADDDWCAKPSLQRYRLLPMSAVRTLIDTAPRSAPEPQFVPAETDPAAIFFTSGTEGTPKGVVLSQGAVVANIQNVLVRTRRLPNQLSDDHPGTVSLMCLPLFHVGGFQTLVSAQLSGGRLLFLEGRFDAEEVLDLIQREKVRFFGGVPTMIARVLDCPRLSDYDTSSVVSIAMGGSLVVPELADKIARGLPSARRSISSIYGQTESGGALTSAGGTELLDKPGCVGKPLSTTEILIDEPDEDGVGEVLARAPTLMSGFLDGNAANPIDEQGWLHTGDLGRLDDEGYLYIVGRSRDIIIRGGENIAPGHVEDRILQHPRVRDVAVVALPHPTLGEEVGAVVVTRPGARVDPEELRAFAAKTLARFEVPTRWWITDAALPLNTTGKVVKRDLVERWLDTHGEEREEHDGTS